jgi:general secretion pathway protein C
MGARLTTLLIWAAVLGSAVAWGLPLFTHATPVPPGASLAAPAPPPGGSLARLLGQPPAAPVAEAPVVAQSSRFQLVGVVAARPGGGSGLALIAVDGKPAKPVRVGREVEPGLRLLTVAHRQVELGPGPGATSVTLNLAPLPEAQRGRPDDMAAPMAAPMAVPGMVVPQVRVAPGVMPGAMRVPPMGQPAVPVPGAPLPTAQPVQQPGTLPYQGETAPDMPVQGGAAANLR